MEGRNETRAAHARSPAACRGGGGPLIRDAGQYLNFTPFRCLLLAFLWALAARLGGCSLIGFRLPWERGNEKQLGNTHIYFGFLHFKVAEQARFSKIYFVKDWSMVNGQSLTEFFLKTIKLLLRMSLKTLAHLNGS